MLAWSLRKILRSAFPPLVLLCWLACEVYVWSSLSLRERSAEWKAGKWSAVATVPCERWPQFSVDWGLQWRPCFFLKILLKAFLLRLLDASLSHTASSVGLLLAGSWTPVPRPLPEEVEEVEDENATWLSVLSEVTQSERVEQEEVRPSIALPLSSPRLELFSSPPPLTLELGLCRGWSLADRSKGLELYRFCDSFCETGRAESESERFIMSLKDRETIMAACG